MSGLLNGIGGHREKEDNSYEDCAVRELKEKCDLDIKKSELIKIGEITDSDKFYVAAFASIIEENRINQFKSMTSEIVYYLKINEIDDRILFIDAKNFIKLSLDKLKS